MEYSEQFHSSRLGVHGAATSNNADVYAYATAKVKKGLEIGKRLGGESYVFWGGREGYETLLIQIWDWNWNWII